MARKLDIGRVLRAADQRDFTFYQRLRDDEKKEFVYSLVLRFCSSIAAPQKVSEDYLLRLNERVNQHGDTLWRHPDLVFAMLASCGDGKLRKHEYSKAGSATSRDRTLADFLCLHWPGTNDQEHEIILAQMDKAAFTQLLRESGLDAETEKKIAAAYAKSQSNRKAGR